MKKYLILALTLLFAGGCATMRLARQNVVNPSEIIGNFNMITIGGTFGGDAERLVILDLENDAYTFRPVTGPGRVASYPGLPADQALTRAEDFFADHCAYRSYQIRELVMPDHGLIGYELLPDYPTALCEDGNEILVSYGGGNDGEIRVYTTLLLKVGGEDDDNSMLERVAPAGH